MTRTRNTHRGVTRKYHVLLVGIDAYVKKPLRGCVNDIDAIQRLLLGPGVGLAATSIQRLASPHAGARHETRIPSSPATLANLRAALAELGTAKVAPGDRVFIYYSGHGFRFAGTSTERAVHREALAPADCHAGHLLWDHQLNELVRAITKRTRSVTLVLDACHAAGLTRGAPPGLIARCLEPDDVPRAATSVRDAECTTSATTAGLGRGMGDCHVVSACLDHEQAYESRGGDGVIHGLLTRALIRALIALTETSGADLRTLSWARIWHLVCDHVERERPAQHVWMSGNAGRAVLAGPPVDADPGLWVTAGESGEFRVAAGTLAGVTPGARIAIYGERPPRFPPVGSGRDLAARLPTLLQVVTAERATATARAERQPFTLPPGARGRMVRAGANERLRVAMRPHHAQLARALARSRLLELTDSRSAQVRLHRRQAAWAVTDELHAGTADSPALVTLELGQLHAARNVLEHYARYALPLQIAARASDWSGALQLSVLVCPGYALTAAAAQEAELPEATGLGRGTYDLPAGTPMAFRVHNRSPWDLRVSLVNCAPSGRVLILGDHAIVADSAHVFWSKGNLGEPFVIVPGAGSSQCIDRLLAIGRAAMGTSLDFLRVDQSFHEIIARTWSAKKDAAQGDDPGGLPPLAQWTATQVVIRTRRTPRRSGARPAHSTDL